MNILFICANLEPGKDGVGDYTRKLSGELLKQNNRIAIIALNDRFIDKAISEGHQTDETEQIPVLRFSSNLKWKQRLEKTEAFIEVFKPDWISLQYVPYGFNKKGLPFHLTVVFKELSKKKQWHIMFHETWIGISSLSPFRHRFYGFFQKRIATSLIKEIQPKVITTTNVVYRLILQEEKVNAECLPLFSNIAVHKKDENYLSYLENNYEVELRSDNSFKLGIFGTLYPEANLSVVVPNFIREKKINKTIILIVFGKNNRPEERDKLKRKLNDSVIFIELGELSAEKISNIFKILDEAVLCTPLEYIGKSGTYAALKLHEVNVAIISSSPIPRYEKDIIQYNSYLAKREAYKWDVKYVSEKFISLLKLKAGEQCNEKT